MKMDITFPALAFDYADLPPELASSLRNQADHVRERARSTTKAIIEIGRDLLTISPWLEAKFAWVVQRLAEHNRKPRHEQPRCGSLGQ